MGRPFSQDLCEQVVKAAATTSRRPAAARFGVGIARRTSAVVVALPSRTSPRTRSSYLV